MVIGRQDIPHICNDDEVSVSGIKDNTTSVTVPEKRDWPDLTLVCLVEAFSGLEQCHVMLLLVVIGELKKLVWRRGIQVCIHWFIRGESRHHLACSRGLRLCPSAGIESVYWWEGKVQTDAEGLLIIKIRESLLNALTEHVANHEYNVPEVIALPISRGNPKYLEWLKNNTKEN